MPHNNMENNIQQNSYGSGDNIGRDKIISAHTSKSFKKTSVWTKVGIVFTIIGFAFSVYVYYKPSSKENSMNIQQNSYGSGDNIGRDKIILNQKPTRHMNDELKNQIIEIIPEKSSVDIRYLISDQEAMNFASEIKIFLEEKEYTVNSFLAAIYNPPIVGQTIITPAIDPKISFQINVGSSN
jgi:rRNA processing protein Gar1